MPVILVQTLEIAKAYLPRLVKELKKANELKAIQIRQTAGLMSNAETQAAVDALMKED